MSSRSLLLEPDQVPDVGEPAVDFKPSRAIRVRKEDIRDGALVQQPWGGRAGEDVPSSEVDGDIEPRKPRIEHRRRRQPRRAVGDGIVGLVVRRSGVAVEQIVEVDRDVRPGPAESQDLADADVE